MDILIVVLGGALKTPAYLAVLQAGITFTDSEFKTSIIPSGCSDVLSKLSRLNTSTPYFSPS